MLVNAYMDVGGTIPGMESVESSPEPRPRATHGAKAETSIHKLLVLTGLLSLTRIHALRDISHILWVACARITIERIIRLNQRFLRLPPGLSLSGIPHYCG